MTAPTPYLAFDGVAADALRFYRSVFGGDLTLHTFADFGRTDGPPDAVAHGELHGPVDLFATDAAAGEASVRVEGIRLALLGAAAPTDLARWFNALSVGGEVTAALEARGWGDVDGTVTDRFGLTWLIGYAGGATD